MDGEFCSSGPTYCSGCCTISSCFTTTSSCFAKTPKDSTQQWQSWIGLSVCRF
uniref:Uncharacterized protein n=1 Tax=Picea sitchensis TaxID=3332 RepID=A9NW48_PICSI|nr:unknown [Picea sitchensis]